ncbi:type VII secretion system-associated protein [Streptomyces sp. NPDC001744]|uniref:type VII secretion system-associated protein n=1 Tax=Streptomyces sp. NPDC001744 TaxID=3364606 RepID=UPI00369DB970
MAEKTDLSHLDVEALERFLRVEGQGIPMFTKRLAELGATESKTGHLSLYLLALIIDTPTADIASGGPALGKLLTEMKAESSKELMGKTLIANLKTTAQSLGNVLVNQKILFENIKRELEFTITDMKAAKETSLEDIEGQKAIDEWPSILNPAAPTGGVTPPK